MRLGPCLLWVHLLGKDRTMKYRVQILFTTDRPLTREEVSTLDYSALLLAAEPVGDDGEQAEWSGRDVAVTVWIDGEPVR